MSQQTGSPAAGGHGIETLSGRLTASEAAMQAPKLPVLILGWGPVVAAPVALS